MKIYDLRLEGEEIFYSAGTAGSLTFNTGSVDFSAVSVPVISLTGTDSTDINSDNYVNVNSGMDVNINSVNDTWLFAQNDVNINCVNKIKLTANGGNIELIENGGGSIYLTTNEGEVFISSTGASDGNVTIEATTNLILNSDGMLVNTPSGITYGDDYSTDYTDRTLVDKAYVDSVAGSLTEGNGIDITDGTVSLDISTYTTDGSISLSANTGTFAITSDTLSLGGNNTTLNSAQASLTMNGSFNVFASSATNRSIQYSDDYSADFLDRSLVDKAYVDNAVNPSVLPQFDDTSRSAVENAGQMIFNTTSSKAQCYDGTTWNDLW